MLSFLPETDPKEPYNFEEHLVWYAIICTYGFYLIGGLYIVGSVLGWILLYRLFLHWWEQSESTPPEQAIAIPIGIWVWIAGMLAMSIALIAGHLDFNLPLGQMLKSIVGWAKGWASLALFPLAGCLNIRPQILYRAACVVCLITLFLSPLFLASYYLRLPPVLYVSPLQAVGGPGPEFFEFRLYELDPSSNNAPRWRLFTPWAPALGFVANIYFFLVLQEKQANWRWVGMAGCVLMCMVSASRLALLCLPVVWLLTWVLAKLSRPTALISLGIASTLLGLIAPKLIEALNAFSEGFSAARADSSRVRATLGRIAVDRWWREAPIWGHGTVEGGGHIVEYMPIGSHHSWFGLLFVKGIVGLLALAVPMLYSFFDLLFKAQRSETAKVGLSMILVLFLYTFGENLEILAYLVWPGLLMIGIGFKASDREGSGQIEILRTRLFP
ncbi:Capsular biosynthesis protein [Tumidithrix helvetica PCC 7403]|uniref:O-antigen ligase family protein n=1 Tax=Tumidithrix helvetica TaxID=3457545 RepID=UPI003C9FC53B